MNDYDVNEIQSKVIQIADVLAAEFKLPLNRIEFIRDEGFYGKCTTENVLMIKIEFYDGELVPRMEVWRTLGHEMAHLKHRNHNFEFWEFNRTLVNRISELVGFRVRPEIAIFLDRKNGVIS